MRELRAIAAAPVQADVDTCAQLLADVEAYPSWCREIVERVQWDRSASPPGGRVKLRLGRGPLAGRFDELMEVRVVPSGRVSLVRVPHGPTDPERLEVSWLITPGPPTRLELELNAVLDVPRLVPLGGLADSVAQDLVAAAVRALSPGSPITSDSSS